MSSSLAAEAKAFSSLPFLAAQFMRCPSTAIVCRFHGGHPMRLNLSIDTGPQQQEAASPRVVAVRSSSR